MPPMADPDTLVPAEIWAQALDLEAEAIELRRAAIRAALERCHGMVSSAARILGIHRSALRNALDGAQYSDLKLLADHLRQKAGYNTRGGVPRELRAEPDDE